MPRRNCGLPNCLQMLPKRASQFSAGLDLFSAEMKVILPGCQGSVKTDVAIMLPPGTYGRIAPRSGLALNNFIGIGGGVIDEDFTGNVTIILFNHGQKPFTVNIRDRIAQLIIEKISYPAIVEVENLTITTERGEKGFGSSGK